MTLIRVRDWISTSFTHRRGSHSTSPYNIHTLSSKQVMRINKYLSLLLCQIVSPCHDIKKIFPLSKRRCMAVTTCNCINTSKEVRTTRLIAKKASYLKLSPEPPIKSLHDLWCNAYFPGKFQNRIAFVQLNSNASKVNKLRLWKLSFWAWNFSLKLHHGVWKIKALCLLC